MTAAAGQRLRSVRESDEMKPSELVERFYNEIWNQRALSAISELCDDNFSFRGSLGVERKGPDEFAEYVRSVTDALGNYRCDIQDLVVDENRAFAKMLFSGDHRAPLLGFAATGRRVKWAGAALFGFENDKIKSLWVLGDVHGLIKQLSTSDA